MEIKQLNLLNGESWSLGSDISSLTHLESQAKKFWNWNKDNSLEISHIIYITKEKYRVIAKVLERSLWQMLSGILEWSTEE